MNEVVMKIITNPVVLVILLLCILIIIFQKPLYTFFIGHIGEYWTKQELKKLPKDIYKTLNNIMISVNEKTSQIDHIVVSKYGIFVIETKQYNGYITGSKYDMKWERKVGNKKYYYSNPIRQNYGHVKALSELLNMDEKKVFNIVCIPSTAKLKIKHDGELVRNYTLIDKVLSYKKEVIDNVDEILNIINKRNITDRNKRKDHINTIKNNIVELDNTKCPKCGGDLVTRNGKNGEFLGCSNYPKCKYTRNK